MRMTGGHSGPGQGRLGHMSHGSHGHGMMMQQYPPAQPAPQANMSSCEHQVCMQRGGKYSSQ